MTCYVVKVDCDGTLFEEIDALYSYLGHFLNALRVIRLTFRLQDFHLYFEDTHLLVRLIDLRSNDLIKVHRLRNLFITVLFGNQIKRIKHFWAQ